MNYLKLKQKIYEAIERNPLDRSAYEEMFAVCREYEKIDFQTAHAWNHELRNRISWGLRMTVCSQKFDEAREFDDLMFRSLLFGAQHFFDDYLQAVEYGKPLDKKFYQPRRHYLRRYVDAYQEILDGKLDFLSISMPKRAGKSQLGINFTNMLSGKYPDRATLMEGTGDDLVKSFYLGCLEYLTLPSDYHFYDIFPESKLVQTNADTKIINLLHKSRFPTVMCRSIDARQVGLSEATNLLYLDDCVEGREEAKNRQRLDDKWEVMGNGKTYQFTLTKAVPKGGQIVWNGAWDQDPLKYDIKTYASPTSTTVIETVKPTEGTGGTELTTLNSGQRMCYGSNNYKESAVREWLNSDKVAGSVWTPATNYDRPPSWVSNKAGFMNGMDADFLAVIGKTTKVTCRNNVTDGGGSDTTKDKFFLLSRRELFMGDEVSSVKEGEPYPYYSNYSDYTSPNTGADSNRVKYKNGSPQWQWERTPNAGGSYNVRIVNSAGFLNGSNACSGGGVAPACNVI